MTTWIEGNRSFFFASQAEIVRNDAELASTWASPHIVHNPALRYVLGRFVEADRPNKNRQLFSLEGLQMARPTIQYAPMNMNHAQRRVVGAFVASELIYPIDTAAVMGESGPLDGAVCPHCLAPVEDPEDDTCPRCGESYPERTFPDGTAAGGETRYPPRGLSAPSETPMIDRELTAAAEAGLNPYIEALGVFWQHYFPDEYELVEDAHADGRLFYSMECIPREIQCAGAGGCGQTYEYAGRVSDTYCDHLNKSSSDKFLIGPHFTAGAIIVPPVNPGWTRADIHSLVSHHAELAERIYTGMQNDFPHLNAAQWEAAMAELIALANR